MRISDALVEKLLKKTGTITAEQIAALKEQEKADKKPMQDLVIKNNLINEKDLTKLYADEIEVPFIELNAKEIKAETLKILPERIAQQYKAVVFDIDQDGTNLVAMEDPDDIQAINFLRKQLGTLRVYTTTSSLLQSALDAYRGGNISSELTKVIATGDDAEIEEEAVDEDDVAEDSPIAQTVNL